MDSGMSLEQDVANDFDPLAPLLPEELCWILDRMFACEVNRPCSLLPIPLFNVFYVFRWNGILEIPFRNLFSPSFSCINWLILTRIYCHPKSR